jgi:hypothetical protein
MLMAFQSQVSQFVVTRKTEKENLINEIQHAIVGSYPRGHAAASTRMFNVERDAFVTMDFVCLASVPYSPYSQPQPPSGAYPLAARPSTTPSPLIRHAARLFLV